MKRNSHLILLACSCVVMASPSLPAEESPQEPVHKKLGPLFTHVLLDNVLHRHVRQGRFDYAAAIEDKDLAAYMDSLADAQPETFLSDDQRLVFWINVYNACVIKGIADAYPVKSVKDIPNFWSGKRYNVAGTNYSLTGIESMMKKKFQNPRVAFVLCRGSVDGPSVPDRVYNVWDSAERIEKATKAFINSKAPKNIEVDKIGARATFSKLFLWYQDLFDRQQGGLPAFLLGYMEPKVDAKYLYHDQYTTSYYDWNWRVNAAKF